MMETETDNMMIKKHHDVIQQLRKNAEAFTTESFTDEYLLRFLKAKSYDLQKAEKLLRFSLNVRQLYQLDSITQTYQKSEILKKCEFSGFLGFDKEGSPIQYAAIGGGDFNGFLQAKSIFDICLYCSYCIENLLELQRQHNKKIGKYSEGNISAIFDLKNFTLPQMAYKHVIEAGLDTMRMFQDNYPGFLNRVFVVNAPSYFSVVFNIFKPILKMDIIQRILVCNEDSSPSELLKYIDADVLPVFLGGNRVDENGDPKCSSFLKFGCKVPEESYGSNNPHLSPSDPGALEINVPARAAQDVLVDVDVPGSKLHIEFWSDSTIGLCILFRSTNKSRNGLIPENHYIDDERLDDELTSPYSKIQSHLAPVDNYVHCSRAGIYILRFDNTFSWMVSKRIVYRTQVLPPNVS